MTTENDRFDGEPAMNDPTLSRTYREAASEATPRRLDATVLAAARRAAGPKYLLPVSWFRPLAWTATVGLCLAFAINLTITPPQESIVPPVKFEQDAAADHEPRAAEERLEAQPSAMAEQKRLRQQPASVAVPAPRDEEAAQPDVALSTAAERADVRELESGSADLAANAPLRDATAARAAAYALRDADAVAKEAGDSAAVLCAAENLAAPDAWLRCIDALESEGRTEAAARERRRFELKFPDYDVD